MIFGNPGGGKSWTLIALGGYAVKMGYNVLHYTLELGEDYVGRRYDAFFTNIPVNRITEQKNRSKVEEVVETLPEPPVDEFSEPTLEERVEVLEGQVQPRTGGA